MPPDPPSSPEGSRAWAWLSSQGKHEADDAGREARLRRQRALRRVVERFANEVRLDLDPAVHVPVDAERRHAVAVAEDHVGARAARRRFPGGPAAEGEALEARREL